MTKEGGEEKLVIDRDTENVIEKGSGERRRISDDRTTAARPPRLRSRSSELGSWN